MPININGNIVNSQIASTLNYKSIVTRGLSIHFDASAKDSYPETGTSWFDLVTSTTGTLQNGPTYSSDGNGSISFDGTKIDSKIKKDLENRFEKVNWMSTTKTAELAKILVDTTYYGWLINYAQITKMICEKENVDFDEMWKFADEIHENLGNRPKMFPGIIGGHCVIPNLDLKLSI